MKKFLKLLFVTSFLLVFNLTQLSCLTQGNRLSPRVVETVIQIAEKLNLPSLEENDPYAIDRTIILITETKTELDKKFDPQLYNLLQILHKTIYDHFSIIFNSIPQFGEEPIKLLKALYNYQSKGLDKHPFRYPVTFALLTISKIIATQDEGYQGPTYSQKQLASFATAIKYNFSAVYTREQKAIQDLKDSTLTKGKIQNLCKDLTKAIPLAHAWWLPQNWQSSTFLKISASCCFVALAVAIIVGTRNMGTVITELIGVADPNRPDHFTAGSFKEFVANLVGRREGEGEAAAYPEESLKGIIHTATQTFRRDIVGMPDPDRPGHFTDGSLKEDLSDLIGRIEGEAAAYPEESLKGILHTATEALRRDIIGVQDPRRPGHFTAGSIKAALAIVIDAIGDPNAYPPNPGTPLTTENPRFPPSTIRGAVEQGSHLGPEAKRKIQTLFSPSRVIRGLFAGGPPTPITEPYPHGEPGEPFAFATGSGDIGAVLADAFPSYIATEPDNSTDGPTSDVAEGLPDPAASTHSDTHHPRHHHHPPTTNPFPGGGEI